MDTMTKQPSLEQPQLKSDASKESKAFFKKRPSNASLDGKIHSFAASAISGHRSSGPVSQLHDPTQHQRHPADAEIVEGRTSATMHHHPATGDAQPLELHQVERHSLDQDDIHLEPAPSSEDEDFVDNFPTSFVLNRSIKRPEKSLALMLEDAISTHSDGMSNHQVGAIRQYFQELDRVAVRAGDAAADGAPPKSGAPEKLLLPHFFQAFASAAPHQQAATTQQAPAATTVSSSATDSSDLRPSSHWLFSDTPVVRDVHIAGASGAFADFVNGIYEPTSQHCCGMTVYQKRDDKDKWLEYSNAADRWNVLDSAHRGQCWGWAYLTTHRSIEKCKGLTGWKIFDGCRSVDDLNIRVNIVDRIMSATDSDQGRNFKSSTDSSNASTNTNHKAAATTPLASRSIGSTHNDSSLPPKGDASKSALQTHDLSIIEILERTLTQQPAAAQASHSDLQDALDEKFHDWYQRNLWAVVRMQALFRGQRERRNFRHRRQRRMTALVHDLQLIQQAEIAGLSLCPEKSDSSSVIDATAAVVGLGAAQSSPLPTSHVSVFHPVHNSSSKNRSVIDSILKTGIQSDAVDLDKVMLVLQKSKLFKNHKIGKISVSYAAICCELVDFAVINFKLETRDQAVAVFQKLVDSKHLVLLHDSPVFKDEHALISLPHHAQDTMVLQKSSSVNMASDFAIVVESIWRDNNMRIACAIVSDVMSNREPRTSYEGWRSSLHDVAYNKGLRAIMFCILLVHLGLGFYMTREISWKGECRNHPSELDRVRDILYAETAFCGIYVLYLSIRISAGIPKALRRWFFFEASLILAMWADVIHVHATFDGITVPTRFSLPLRALLIACWSNRLRIHVDEIHLSVRKLKVLGGAVLLWIIITATLVTIYIRLVCTGDSQEDSCSQLVGVYFDNAATAMVSLAIMMTTSNYGTISQLFLNRPGQSTSGIIIIFLALIVFMIISYFLLLSMMLAIVFDAFKKGKRLIMSKRADVFDSALIGAFSLLCERDSMCIKHDTYRRFMRMLIPNISTDRLEKYWQFLDADSNGSIALEEFLELSTIVSFQVL
jgi:hypothetical protein